MLKKLFIIKLLAVLFVFALNGCASDPLVLNGTDGSPIPPAFANFPDVPFPDKAYLDLDDTNALGSGDNWIGSVVYTSPYNPSQVFDFYISEMQKNRWLEVAVVRARISQMTYIRQSRALQILIETIKSDESRVTITAVPNDATLK